MLRLIITFIPVFAAGTVVAETVIVTDELHHLRQSGDREWVEFPEQPEAAALDVTFSVGRPAPAYCLRIRQQDVKGRWRIRLNDQLLSMLRVDENDMIVYVPVPEGVVRTGSNRLVIDCPGSKAPDDIRVGEIRLIDRSRKEVLSQATLIVHVHDGARSPAATTATATGDAGLPARITVLDQAGTLRDTGAVSGDHLAVRPGTIYTASGFAALPVEPGTYRIVAGRGFEYSIDSVNVTIRPGETREIPLTIHRDVPTAGWVACDTHVHTRTHSGHGDCTVQERMITLAAEGIELPVATDHNVQIDHEPFAREMNVRQHFTPVIGNEVTTRIGHFNIFPVHRNAPVPDHRGKTWTEIFDAVFRTPGVRAVILNHARDRHSGFRPFDPLNFNDETGINVNGWQLRANAMETLNSSATQTDIMQLFHDWMALLNSGHAITPVGSSDSHDVARHFAGQGRTYIRCDDSDPGRIDVQAAAQAFVDGRVVVSYGLFTELRVDGRLAPGELCPVSADRKTINVQVRVLGPHWSQVDHVQLFANGVPVAETDLTQLDRRRVAHASLAQKSRSPEAAPDTRGVKFEWSIRLPRPKQDVHLVAIARGPGIRESWWKTAKPYMPDSPVWKPQTLSCSGAVWLDIDGDGRRSCAADYAAKLVDAASGQLETLLALLAPYDSAVAAQAAHQYQQALGDPVRQRRIGLETADAQRKTAAASPDTRAGIQRYLDAVRRNRIAILGQ